MDALISHRPTSCIKRRQLDYYIQLSAEPPDKIHQLVVFGNLKQSSWNWCIQKIETSKLTEARSLLFFLSGISQSVFTCNPFRSTLTFPLNKELLTPTNPAHTPG